MKAIPESNSRLVVEAVAKQQGPEVLTTKQSDANQAIVRSMAKLLALDLPESLTGSGLAQTGPELAKLAQLCALGLIQLN